MFPGTQTDKTSSLSELMNKFYWEQLDQYNSMCQCFDCSLIKTEDTRYFGLDLLEHNPGGGTPILRHGREVPR